MTSLPDDVQSHSESVCDVFKTLIGLFERCGMSIYDSANDVCVGRDYDWLMTDGLLEVSKLVWKPKMIL